MPGSAFKSRTVKQAPGKTPGQAPEKAKVSAAADKQTFAKEMHFQVYRIENVLKISDAATLKGLASKSPDLLKQPSLMRFFSAYQGKKTNEFIEQAKGKTKLEREKLLDGIRKVIFKAKRAKLEYAKKRTGAEKKAQTDQQKEVAKMQEMLKRDLTNEDVLNVETNLATPFTVDKRKMDLNKVQYFYTTIMTGQKAFGTHMQGMQKSYGGAIKKFEANNKKYTSGWRKYAGIADWGWRKAKSVGGWLKSGWNWARGKKSKPSKSPSDKVNEAISNAREHFQKNIDRLKLTKKRIAARSKELKKGLGDYKGDIREKLKSLISREDWTKAQQLKESQLKELLEKHKKSLNTGLSKAQQKGKEIDDARGRTSKLSTSLQTKYKSIQSGEGSLNSRVKAVEKRIADLKKQGYKNDDKRIVFLIKQVLVPLMQGQDRMAQVKEGTAAKLNNVEDSKQRLDLLKADAVLSETSAVTQISKIELQIKFQGEKMKTLGGKRLELTNLLEGMETAYMAVDEFKGSIDKNLDKMLVDNNKAVKAVDKQYDVLKKVKASEPGIGTSLYNTVGIGHYGAYGYFIELPFKYGPRAIGYSAAWLSNKAGFTGEVSWKDTEKWHIGGVVEYIYKKYDGWLSKGALKQYTDNWFTDTFAGVGNVVLGAVGSVLGLAHGVTSLVLETPKVLDSLGVMATDLGELKRAMLGIIHYNDLEKGNYEVWTGRIAGDLIVLFFTAGSSAGASAAAAAGKAGASMAGRAVAYAGAFLKEIGTKTLMTGYGGGKFVIGTAWKTLRHPIIAAKGAGMVIAHTAMKQFQLIKGLVRGRGLKDYIAYTSESISKQGGKLDDLAQSVDDVVKGFDSKLVKSPELKKLLEKAQKEGGVKKLSIDQLDDLSVGLRNEMYRYSRSGKHVPGFKGRIQLEGLANKVRSFNRLKIKHKAMKEVLVSRYLKDVTANDLLKVQPSSASGARGLKSAIKNKLDDLYNSVDDLTERMSSATGKLKTKLGKKIARNEKKIAGLKDKFKEVSVWEFVKKKPIEYVTAAKEALKGMKTKLDPKRLANAPAKLKQLYEKIKENPMMLWDNPAVAIGAWPVWVPTLYIRRMIAGKAGQASRLSKAEGVLRTQGVQIGGALDSFANVRGISAFSTKINTMLKAGQLKEAVKLYYSARVVARKNGIPIGAMDKSFLGFVHKVAPGSANYMGKVSDLLNPLTVEQLPNDAKVNMSKLESYEKSAETSLTKFIKSKPKSIPKIPPKKK